MDNCSDNVCNISYQDGSEVSPIPYIVISLVHVLTVIVPTVPLGTTILYHVGVNKEMRRDPITILFCAVTITSMLSASVFGLLIDMSMFADLPLLGSCSSPSRAVSVGIGFFVRILTPNQIALISCWQFLVIKYGKKLITIERVLASFGVVMAIIAVVTLIILSPNLGEYEKAVSAIRGSWCKENRVVLKNGIIQSVALTATVILCPVTLVVVFSIRSYLIVKQSVIENDKIVKSVLFVCATTLILEFGVKIPLSVTTYLSVASDSSALLFFTISMSDIEYSFTMLLFMTAHRGIRNAVFSEVVTYIENASTVVPQNEL